MAETPSTMVQLGTQAPNFDLPNAVDDRRYSLKSFDQRKAFLVMFICNHCPYVVHVMKEFARLEKDYVEKGLAMVAINSNDVTSHSQDGPSHMKNLAEREGWSFPFLFDENQEVAKTYKAACTPDFFLFDGTKKLAYRGQLDEARPGNSKPVNGKDLRAAIDAVLTGKPVTSAQRPSMGCNIKWRRGNEPTYY